jgi:hypothetical protein
MTPRHFLNEARASELLAELGIFELPHLPSHYVARSVPALHSLDARALVYAQLAQKRAPT